VGWPTIQIMKMISLFGRTALKCTTMSTRKLYLVLALNDESSDAVAFAGAPDRADYTTGTSSHLSSQKNFKRTQKATIYRNPNQDHTTKPYL
jgi:hypothetical protein